MSFVYGMNYVYNGDIVVYQKRFPSKEFKNVYVFEDAYDKKEVRLTQSQIEEVTLADVQPEVLPVKIKKPRKPKVSKTENVGFDYEALKAIAIPSETSQVQPVVEEPQILNVSSQLPKQAKELYEEIKAASVHSDTVFPHLNIPTDYYDSLQLLKDQGFIVQGYGSVGTFSGVLGWRNLK